MNTSIAKRIAEAKAIVSELEERTPPDGRIICDDSPLDTRAAHIITSLIGTVEWYARNKGGEK